MLLDVFMFDDEFDMLDCRIYQMRGLVDQFVVIEANRTVSGVPKPFHLSENLSRYPDAPLQVIRMSLDDVHGDWERDKVQRAGATDYLEQFPPDTLVIYGDLDEIIRRSVIEDYVKQGTTHPVSITMRHLVYSCHWQHPDGWYGGVLAPRGSIGDMTEVRYSHMRGIWPKAHDGGWHLSWFGTPEARSRKMRHFAHQEMVHTIGDKVAEEFPRKHIHVDGQATLIPYEGSLPDWISEGHAPTSWYERWEES